MTVRVEVIAVLERYDDAAWSALASRGLLRRARKDLERLTPEVVAEGPDMLEVVVGDATVSFGPAGPPAARCTCPAGATCQHVITAALWLVAADPAAGGEVQSVSPGDELLRMSAGELRAAAGAAAYRWAREFVEELPADRFRVVEGHHLVLSLTSPRVSFHVTGGGLAGVVADVKLPNVERYQVAVVLAYQRANGVELEPVRTRAGLDGALAARRAAVREAVERLACDTVQVGVAHLSESLRQRYETLAVSAQGAEYYRLASMLRGLTGEVERVLTRSARADEQALLEQLATTYALVTALGTLGDLPRLVGTARGRFEASGRLELVGLGAVPWRTASGHAGLTVVLWSESEQQFVTWTDSRPPGVPFDPRARYTAPGPWSGVLNPAALTGARVTLLNARSTPSGRRSGTEATHATCTPLTTPNLRPITRWSDLPSPHP
ncbi:hypothetical protein, partial [Kribbella sandramycini]|uniref:hypothetical protein n=1 Tax=Kribbella sandramycini TaxID=60450 RepID=UPI0031DDE1F0